jgi:hypothetical protein
VRGIADTLRRELAAAGPGDALVAALVVSAFYLGPVFGGGPWLAALVLTCLAGGVLLIWRPSNIRRIPLVIVFYVAAYVLSGLTSGLGGAGEIARYIVRPVAIGALTLFLVSPASRRRAVAIVVIATLPQVIFTAGQAVKARVDYGAKAVVAADSVTGTFGDSAAAVVGLAALAAAVLVAGLALAGVIGSRPALGLVVALLAVEVFSSTRVAVVFVPLAALVLAAVVVVVKGRRTPPRTLVTVLAVGALAVPAIYLGSEAIYPGAFVGAFSNQTSQVLVGDSRPAPPAKSHRGGGGGGRPAPKTGPHGVAVLPGRGTQIERAVQISTEDGGRVFLLGRGFGAAAVPDDAYAGSVIPKAQTTGAIWIGRVLGDGGWLALGAFLVLLAWLAWLGVRVARCATDPWEVGLGYALPPFAALTFAGATYTTILDVRGYSATFIVLAAVVLAAARDLPVAGQVAGNGRRARASTPLPPRQAEISEAPSASTARST